MSAKDAIPGPATGRQIVQSYGGGGFRIAGRAVRGSCLVFADRIEAWSIKRGEDISAVSLEPFQRHLETLRILIVGCGARFTPAPANFVATLRGRGLAVEWMDTGAACRTFNVLLAEDRPVAAALVAVD